MREYLDGAPARAPEPHVPSVLPVALMTRVLVAAIAAITLASAANAAEQSTAQQRCINDLNKHGSKLTREAGKNAYTCLKDAAAGKLEALGGPGQEQSAQACLRNDVRGKLAKRSLSVVDRDLARCLALPEQLPGFAYAGATAVTGSASDRVVELVADLFGPDLDAAVAAASSDEDAPSCQREVLKRTTRLLDDTWKEIVRHKKSVLKGRDRLQGGDPKAPVTSAVELQVELTVYVDADPRAKIAKSRAKLEEHVTSRCGEASLSIAEMFPGLCVAATTTAELADCAATRVRARFFAALAGMDALAIDCDLTDNGTFDLSCVSAETKHHVLNRIGYGPDAWSSARFDGLGVQAYILEQLDPSSIDESALEAELAARFPSLAMTFNELRTNYPKDDPDGGPERGDVARELKAARLARSIVGRRQLEQVLTEFWYNHFNVDVSSSGRTKYDATPYERIAIRPYALGSFRDMALAVARSPAMGDYLDNRLNTVNAINENFGREFMELHTVGVDGGFTEADVIEASRCLTGWREDYDNDVDGFSFQAGRHDDGPKSLFAGALQIPAGGGEQDGIDLVDWLSEQEATAELVSRKLVVRFVNENPPSALVAEAASTFLATGGDIRAVLETILLSDEFLSSAANRGSKLKRPLHQLVSAARALGADPWQIQYRGLDSASADMGEALYTAGPPTGYPDVSGFWASPGTVVTRFKEIERIARGKDGFVFVYPVSTGTSVEIVDALIAMILPAGASEETTLTAVAFLDTLDVGDPQRVEQAAAFLMSSPEFLYH